jgi:hypothetical protein
MARIDGTRFTKAATPQAGGALNVANRTLGSNPRKQKLTEAPGTNPSKMGATKISSESGGGENPSRYAQNTAPHKSMKVEFPFDVGGPGLDQFKPKGFK